MPLPTDESPSAIASRRKNAVQKLHSDAAAIAGQYPGQHTRVLLEWLEKAVNGPHPLAFQAGPGTEVSQTPDEYRAQCLERAAQLAQRTHEQLQAIQPQRYATPLYEGIAQIAAELQAEYKAAIAAATTTPESAAPRAEPAAAAPEPEATAVPEANAAAAPPPPESAPAADPPPERCQVLLEPANLLPAVLQSFPEELRSNLRFHGEVTLSQYIALTGDTELAKLKLRLAYTGEHEDGWSLPIPVESLLTSCNGWEALQTQLFRCLINSQGQVPERCPDDQPTLLKIAKDLEEVSYSTLLFLGSVAEAYPGAPFKMLLEQNYHDALQGAEPPVTLADLLRDEEIDPYLEYNARVKMGRVNPAAESRPGSRTT